MPSHTHTVKLSAVESSNVAKIGWSIPRPELDYADLHVQFHSSPTVYVYGEVSGVDQARFKTILDQGESIGKAINQLIKPKYEVKYTYEIEAGAET